MDLKISLKIIKKHLLTLGLSAAAGLIIGFTVTEIPGKYIVSGTFFIGRTTDKMSTAFFTYEGYYAQQTAQSYTNSAIAVLESDDLKKQTLEELGVHPTSQNIKKLTRSIQVTKEGPQVISLSVRDRSQSNALATFKSLSKNFIAESVGLNYNADQNLSIAQLNSEPVIKNPYPQPVLMGIGGALFGTALGLLLISIKEYFK